MAPTLVLSIGFTPAGVPVNLYTGVDLSAAQAAAAAEGRSGSYRLIRIYRNLPSPSQEFTFPAA
jgi:hypothetical protein